MGESDSEGRREFGVLFVGGIEHQRPGSAIASFSAAVYAWLVDWNCGWRRSPGTPPPALREARLAPGDGEYHGPAHLTLDVPLELSCGPRHARWLLAESAWPVLFHPPRFGELARWMWKVSTCLLVMQFVIPMRRHWYEAGKNRAHPYLRLAHVAAVLCYGVLMGIAGMLSVLLSGLLLLLAVAAKLPIPQIDQAVQWTIVKISSVLGDSYVLAQCPVQFAAMRTKVADDLRWLQDRCDRVAVVAHSQGAAIAHQVLRDGDYDPGSLRAFVTFGQGITKMHVLQRMDWDPDYANVARWSRTLVTAGLACAGFPVLAILTSHWFHALAFRGLAALIGSVALIIGGLLVVALGVVCATHTLGAVVEGDLLLPAVCRKFPWIDYYASADPVSNGPLINRPARKHGQRIVKTSGLVAPLSPRNEIYNSGSLLNDHNGYLRNRDQFVSKLLNNLVAAAYGGQQGADPPSLVCDQDIVSAIKRRRGQVAYLMFARMAAVALGVLLPFYFHVKALDGPMIRLIHAIPPHAKMGGLPARLMVALLIAAVAYTALLIPRRMWETSATRTFFSTATRYPRSEAGQSPHSTVTSAA